MENVKNRILLFQNLERNSSPDLECSRFQLFGNLALCSSQSGAVLNLFYFFIHLKIWKFNSRNHVFQIFVILESNLESGAASGGWIHSGAHCNILLILNILKSKILFMQLKQNANTKEIDS